MFRTESIIYSAMLIRPFSRMRDSSWYPPDGFSPASYLPSNGFYSTKALRKRLKLRSRRSDAVVQTQRLIAFAQQQLRRIASNPSCAPHAAPEADPFSTALLHSCDVQPLLRLRKV